MIHADSTLVGAQQPALQQGPDPMHPRHGGDRGVGRLSFQSGHSMPVTVGIQASVARPAIGMYRTAGCNHLLNETMQNGFGGVGNASHANPANSASVFFSGDYHQCLGQRTTSFSSALF